MSSKRGPLYEPRDVLQREEEELLGKLAELNSREGAHGEYDLNFADSSQVIAEKGESEALAETLSSSLAEVRSALSKLDLGTYGKCERCGEQISEVRLEAVPTARLCMTCASKR
jgi:RNA polymerase-binding transcription factor DksA